MAKIYIYQKSIEIIILHIVLLELVKSLCKIHIDQILVAFHYSLELILANV